MKIIVIYIFLLSIYSCQVAEDKKQITRPEVSEFLTADSFLVTEEPTDVMLLGTWHFAYSNNDSHKVDESEMVDFNSEKKQKEILTAVKRFEEFQPTIIAVESSDQHKTDSLYNLFLLGKYKLAVSESEQLGFRLGKRLGLKKIHAVDSYSWVREEYEKYPVLNDLWDDQYYLDTLKMKKWGAKYNEFYSYCDQIIQEYTVDESLKYFNQPEDIRRRLGHYLVELKTSNYNGPDSYALKWYDRNVRIFNNILKTNPKSSDRILAIYGIGHIAILEQLFDASPEFEIVRPYDYLED